MNQIITTIIVILIIIGSIAAVIFFIKHKINAVTRTYLGMDAKQTAKMLSGAIKEEAFMPKPITTLTSVFQPKIQRDFPEIGYAGMEAIAKNGLITSLNAIEAKSTDGMEKYSHRLVEQVRNVIADAESKNESTFYDDIVIHKMGISSYKNNQKEAEAAFEISMQSYYYKTRNNKIVFGTKDKPTQQVFKVLLTYNQEEYLETTNVLFSSNCPNCGAPVSASGADKRCPYCGSGLKEIADRVWQVTNFKVIK